MCSGLTLKNVVVDNHTLSKRWQKALPHTDQELVQRLLQISQTDKAANDQQRHSLRLDSSVCEELIAVAANKDGVIRALALNVLLHWVQTNPERARLCILHGAAPLMLQILSSSLLSPLYDPPTREAASLAVMILRQLARQAATETSAAVLEANGISHILGLAAQLKDSRPLSLTLFLLNDITRRCPETLVGALEHNGVQLMVDILRRPINESTKFAALLLNRWALLAEAVPIMIQAGAQEALFSVLVQRSAAGPYAGDAEMEAAAYALSAGAILAQHTLNATRAKLLADASLLSAISAAVADYEHCFHGVGFPHALMCSLLAGTQGAQIVAAVAAGGLVPTWLGARTVGPKLVERASKRDAQAAMAALPQEAQVEVAIALTHLLPLCPNLVHCLSQEGRVETLTRAALAEQLTPNKQQQPSVTFHATESGTACAPMPSPFAEDEAQAAATVSHKAEAEDVFPKSFEPTATPSGGVTTPDTPTRPDDAPILSRSTDLTAEFNDALKVAAAEGQEALLPSPGLPNLSTPQHRDQQQQQQQDGGAAAELTTDEKPCSDALARLVRFLSEAEAEAAECEKEMDDPPLTRSRKRLCGGPSFCRSEVNAERYDSLTFMVGGKPVHAVGFVLEARSPFLRNLLGTLRNVREKVIVPTVAGLSGERMHTLFLLAVEWCYTGDVKNLTVEDALELWMVAEFLQIDGLQRCCEQTLQQGFADSWALVQQCYELGAHHQATGKCVRVAVARHILTRMMIDNGCIMPCTQIKSILQTYGSRMATDMTEALVDWFN